MTKKWFIIIIALLTVINLSATATILIQRWSSKPPQFKHFNPEDDMRDRLNLSPEQLEKMRDMRDQFFQDMGGSMQKYQALQRKLVEAMSADEIDTTVINQILEEMGQAQMEIRRQTIYHLLANRDFLSPEQRRHLLQMFIKRNEDMLDNPMMPGFHKNGLPFGGEGDHPRGRGRYQQFRKNNNREFMDSIDSMQYDSSKSNQNGGAQ